MQSTSYEIPGWMKHKLVSRLLGEISITSDTQMTPPNGTKRRGNNEPLDEVNEESEKAGLKLNRQENKDNGIGSDDFMANRLGNNGNSDSLYFLGLQNHCRW